MNRLFQKKYKLSKVDEGKQLYWEALQPNRYGFVYVNNPHYYIDGDDRKYLIRKPTPRERKEIIINTLIQCNDRTFIIPELADKLGVSDRTIQNILRQLEKEGLIQITPKYAQNGKQKGNAYKYIGPACKFYGSGLTLKALHNPEENVGFRNWAWKEYEFSHDKNWHSIYSLCKIKFETRIARRKYLEKHNLPLVVPEDIKYLVLRYCYWKDKTEKLNTCYAYKSNELYSKDGTIKLAIEPQNRTEKVSFFGHTLLVEFSGNKDNPEIKISDEKTKEMLGVFTWFTENIIQKSTELQDDLTELFFILGDFTTK